MWDVANWILRRWCMYFKIGDWKYIYNVLKCKTRKRITKWTQIKVNKLINIKAENEKIEKSVEIAHKTRLFQRTNYKYKCWQV